MVEETDEDIEFKKKQQADKAAVQAAAKVHDFHYWHATIFHESPHSGWELSWDLGFQQMAERRASHG